ncbi:hypothetical protein [Rummeliibacillus stabekisii]|uniref:Uncharacterized protein n=1 Tax=Rummeliibacillus stabekisii TaxID=241244 RepID=A0A143H9M6_9BACL|nr:hypothetical protein [Rummeliibacillus stabekisii]AMW98422.1 hypothetical protein ATY39_02635 [Rummeliibacillus stabekisii]
MNKIKVTFSDGSITTFHEEQAFVAVGFFPDDKAPGKNFPSHFETYGLWNHMHDGLTPSFLELLANSKFFFDIEEPNVYYNSQSVIKIESI